MYLHNESVTPLHKPLLSHRGPRPRGLLCSLVFLENEPFLAWVCGVTGPGSTKAVHVRWLLCLAERWVMSLAVVVLEFDESV